MYGSSPTIAVLLSLVGFAPMRTARAWAAAAPAPATTLSEAAVEPSDAVDRRAVSLLEELVASDALRLTMNSGEERLEFLMTLTVPTKSGGRYSSRYLVVRQGSEVAILVLSPTGEPYAYARSGLFVGFSSRVEGRLVMCNRGSPSVTVGGDKDSGNFEMEVSFFGKAERPTVRVDLRSVIAMAAKTPRRATYDEESNVVRLSTPNSEVDVSLAARESSFPITGLAVRHKKGFSIAISNLSADPKHLDLLDVDKARVAKLGLPMHVLGEKEVPKVPLFVPPAFGAREGEQEAIERFRELFPRLPASVPAAATQPSRATTTAPAPPPGRRTAEEQADRRGGGRERFSPAGGPLGIRSFEAADERDRGQEVT